MDNGQGNIDLLANRSLSTRISSIQASPTLAITTKARSMAQSGIDVVSFAAGEPDFDTPTIICDSALEAIRLGRTRYTASAGLMDLRTAIAKKLATDNGLQYAPTQIVVSCGAKHSVYNAVQALINPGDEVILVGPYWMTYKDQVILAGGVPKVLHTKAANGLIPTPDELAAMVTPKTKALILNSPCNPTGVVWPYETLEKLAQLAIRHGFWVIADEIYEKLIYDQTHTSIGSFPGMIDQTITINGCSKTFAMTGWRIGYAASPSDVAQAMSNLQDQVTSNPTTFAQVGAIAALEMDPEIIESMRSEFEIRRNLIVSLLRDIPNVECTMPQGAFYAFPDVSAYLVDGITDMHLAERLLEEAHVAVIPGTVFEGQGHIRLSYATSRDEIEKGIARIAQFLKAIS